MLTASIAWRRAGWNCYPKILFVLTIEIGYNGGVLLIVFSRGIEAVR